jgi:NAD(P)H-hydrate epimerase
MGTLPPAISRAEARAADARAVEDLGIPAACLMENAGRGLADVTAFYARLYKCTAVVVVAARGNNGGDGLVAARHLRLRGLPVRVLLVSPPSAIPPEGDTGRNLAAARKAGILVADASDGPLLDACAAGLPPGVLLVDAVLGTGLEGPVEGHYARVLAWMAAAGAPVVAADVPSGLDADDGRLLGPAPSCVATATFLAPKRGLLLGEGPRVAGRVVVCDIGVPPELVLGPASTGGSPPASRPRPR